ncbi:MAG: protein arginine kinase [Syntrophomonadaceae bacterium]|jgi:protein arginine kinase|nr:protein arginine kinase [Syntrophomonadaceae bacterium]
MILEKILTENDVFWMHAEQGPEADIVISSRVRLARNLKKVPFPHLLNKDNGVQCFDKIKTAWKQINTLEGYNFDLKTLDELSYLDKQILVEKHLISPNHGKVGSHYQGVVLNSNGSICVMINEEDHMRTQCFLPGLQVDKCYEQAEKIDDKTEEYLDIAFDSRRGYLTSCPTNVGTGLRASVMLHLPAIVMSGQIKGIFQNLGQIGMTVRGLYGEGTEAMGNFFQLSNQITIGQSERDINNKLTIISRRLIEQERLSREKILKDMPYQLEDTIGRAYGILTNARIINSNEALIMLSSLRLGVDLGIIKGIKPFTLNELMVAIRPAHLQKKAGREMTPLQRDEYRAIIIKEQLQRKISDDQE